MKWFIRQSDERKYFVSIVSCDLYFSVKYSSLSVGADDGHVERKVVVEGCVMVGETELG